MVLLRLLYESFIFFATSFDIKGFIFLSLHFFSPILLSLFRCFFIKFIFSDWQLILLLEFLILFLFFISVLIIRIFSFLLFLSDSGPSDESLVFSKKSQFLLNWKATYPSTVKSELILNSQ